MPAAVDLSAHVFEPSVPDLYADIPGLHSVIPRPATHVHNFSATTPKFISKHEMQKSWCAIIKANHETIKSNPEKLPKAITTTIPRVVGWGSGAAGMMVVVTTKPRTVGKFLDSPGLLSSWPRLAAEGHCLIILSLELEVALWMVAHGAYLGSLLAHYHVATVAAYPDGVAFA